MMWVLFRFHFIQIKMQKFIHNGHFHLIFISCQLFCLINDANYVNMGVIILQVWFTVSYSNSFFFFCKEYFIYGKSKPTQSVLYLRRNFCQWSCCYKWNKICFWICIVSACVIIESVSCIIIPTHVIFPIVKFDTVCICFFFSRIYHVQYNYILIYM